MTGDKTIHLLVGTRKGAFVFTSEDGRRTWKMTGPHFKGKEVYHMSYDGRNKMLLASVLNNQWGPSVERSFDLGKTWKTSKTPPKFPKKSKLSVERVWHIEPGLEEESDVLYAGVEPACLFKSEDKGETWKANEAMVYHKTRPKWQAGGGGLCLHTILPDERDKNKMHVAISAVGTMFTSDGGESWKFQNKKVRAGDQPKSYPVFGQCVHKLTRNRSRPDVIFHQSHFGVYRSDDNGENWKDIENNLPSRFGFPVAVDANNPERVYVAPLEGDFSRVAPNGAFAVWTSDNSGKEWYPLRQGFPEFSYYTVLREGMVSDSEDPCGLYVGTTTGQVFSSRNQGNEWTRVADGLPTVLSVSVSRA